MRRTVLVMAVLLVWPGIRMASAEQPRVAALPLQHDDSVSEAQENTMRQAVSEALKKNGLSPLPLAEVDRLLMATDISCTSARCLAESAKTLKADLSVGGRLERAGPPDTSDWTLWLWLYDAREGATAGTVREDCPRCGPDRAGAWAQQVISRLLKQAQGNQGSWITVRSHPAGARVSIDGTPAGMTDMTFGIKPGQHSVELRLEGYEITTHQVAVKPGDKAVVDINLVPASEHNGTSSQGGAARVLKWAFLGAAVAGLASGIALLALDGTDNCDKALSHYQCAEVYQTLAPGAALAITGGLLAGASGLMFYLDSPTKESPSKKSLALMPVIHGQGAGVGALLFF